MNENVHKKTRDKRKFTKTFFGGNFPWGKFFLGVIFRGHFFRIVVCFGATYRDNLPIPSHTLRNKIFTRNNTIFNPTIHAHFFYTF